MNELFDLTHSIAGVLLSEVKYPWDALKELKEYIIKLGKSLDKRIYKEIYQDVWVAKSASLSESAHIGSPCIIGENADIRHCAFIRESAIIGNSCVVGNSTEVKNSILFDNVQIPHFNYVGDAILGYKAHLGAGAIISNVKSDKSFIDVKTDEGIIQTGLKKFGALIADECEIGCNCVICPGSVIERGCTVYPLSMVRGYIKENHIYKNKENIICKTRP